MRRPGRHRGRWAWVAAALGVIAAGCGGPPQIGPDREVFKTVDALYTAVSLREPGQVSRCAETIDELTRAGKMPESASKALASVIEETKQEQWKAAQGHLREFMLGQRR